MGGRLLEGEDVGFAKVFETYLSNVLVVVCPMRRERLVVSVPESRCLRNCSEHELVE